jgi:hypothetical protein
MTGAARGREELCSFASGGSNQGRAGLGRLRDLQLHRVTRTEDAVTHEVTGVQEVAEAARVPIGRHGDVGPLEGADGAALHDEGGRVGRSRPGRRPDPC